MGYHENRDLQRGNIRFNVNGVNGRVSVLLRWLKEAAPDVVCLQEVTDAAGEVSGNPDLPGRIQRNLTRSEGLNVMPTDLDVYEPERWADDALLRSEVREAYRLLVEQDWTDALRALHPNERIYTFWDYFRNAYARDAGLRIDHLLLSLLSPCA